MKKTKRIWGTLDPFFEAGPIMGRKVANTTFLHALLAADPMDEYHFFLSGQREMRDLKRHITKHAPDLMQAGRVKFLFRRDVPQSLATEAYYCFHQSDCITSQPYIARLRNAYSERIFPVTGVIHSLSYTKYGNAFLRHLWPGTTPRDAIACTSSAGMESVAKYFNWLRQGFGLDATTHPSPALTRIPLAVNPEVFVPGEGAEGGPVRLLVFGRISHHSKMDVVPLIRALHRLIQDGMDPSSVELVLAGWASKESVVLETLTNLAANAGITLEVHVSPSEAEKVRLFQSADVFVSIADNPQETFGITMVEAGAFGLPVVASDYDGYRDIVVHGTTGLLIPTIGPARTPDVDVMAPVLFDNEYHLQLAQRTAVDVPGLARNLKLLIESPTLRRTMGEAARKRVEQTFSWTVVMGQYVALWDRLWAEPVKPHTLRDTPHPVAPPFGQLFGHYTSQTLNDALVLKAGRTGEAFYRGRDFPNLYAGLHSIIDLELIKKLVFLGRKPITLASLLSRIADMAPQMTTTQMETHVLWALKHDILERVE
ncbi:glycosyltransferase family 4 protein [Pseudodesulfovibrio sediminis]|uniref:Glycosyl transferase n=1 Tax=Pseudodesulfovibrio sediminis TaxID=2810563 RepID=A0ABM7P7X1_9BACT|nr:glycosyltransferase family 4 protein [Pseudodesulfovibrio sediminis]BCS89101.1 glycosyl transferase [Pseudodesulfovibrio sediminis]